MVIVIVFPSRCVAHAACRGVLHYVREKGRLRGGGSGTTIAVGSESRVNIVMFCHKITFRCSLQARNLE